jgi:ABC-type cobalamin/Fe3+-siderophores transport system ATPase subunit
LLRLVPEFRNCLLTCLILPPSPSRMNLFKVRNADKIIVLKDGRAYEEGTHDELIAADGLYAEMWNMQLHSTSNRTSQSNLF